MNKKAELKEVFPYTYEGGGYFRKKGIPRGNKAEILHGMEAIKYVFEKISNNKVH